MPRTSQIRRDIRAPEGAWRVKLAIEGKIKECYANVNREKVEQYTNQ